MPHWPNCNVIISFGIFIEWYVISRFQPITRLNQQKLWKTLNKTYLVHCQLTTIHILHGKNEKKSVYRCFFIARPLHSDLCMCECVCSCFPKINKQCAFLCHSWHWNEIDNSLCMTFHKWNFVCGKQLNLYPNWKNNNWQKI